MLLGIDTETRLIGKGQVIPPLVCAQFGTLMEDGEIFAWIVERAQPDYKKQIVEILSDPTVTMVFHNAAYDLSVFAKEIPETMPLIWKALDEGRVKDTMIREMLFNLTAYGDIENVELNGVVSRAEYSLMALLLKYAGIDRSALKEGEDSVRVNYESVESLLLKDWPTDFVEYALNDPKDTLKVYFEQAVAGQKLFDRIGYDPFVTEDFRVRAHFALQLMTNHGNKLDRQKVEAVAKEFDALYNDPELVRPLVLSSFIEAYADANGENVTNDLMREAIAAFDALLPDDQPQWIGTGIVIPAVPAKPYKTGQKEHLADCVYNKESENYCGKTGKDCNCPLKMVGAQKECGSDKTLHRLIWKAALKNPCIEVWASESLVSSLKEQKLFESFIDGSRVIDQQAVIAYAKEQGTEEWKSAANSELPDGWRVTCNEEWSATFASLHPILEKNHIRSEYEKIITSYLPGLYWNNDYLNCPDILPGQTDRLAGKEPADIVHSCFRPLKLTGRTSSYANTRGKGKNKIYMFPSMNGQQVDPRIRPCIIPRDGYLLGSIDYAGMELGTAAQKCIDLFGFSVLGDVINSGRDAHTYLGMYIAQELDGWFAGLSEGLEPDDMYDLFIGMKKNNDPCPSPDFGLTWKITGHKDRQPLISDFYAHFRKFAKPTGLGYPGGLGPKTFVSYAKATYGVVVDLETAYKLRDIWKLAFPEMALYLDYISNRCFDPVFAPETSVDKDGKEYKRKFYFYDTPLGMHRAKTDFCACANGMALQSTSAEGALLAVQEIQREIFSGEPSILADVDGVPMVRPTIFIHDEIFFEIRDDDFLTARVERMREIMKECMEIFTPDVKAGTEACLMKAWSKKAFEYRVDGQLRTYEEAPKKD